MNAMDCQADTRHDTRIVPADGTADGGESGGRGGSAGGPAAASPMGFNGDFNGQKESRLTHVFGLSRNDLRELRKKLLVKGDDWTSEKRAVVYTAAGVEKMRAHLAVGKITAPVASSALPAPVTLLVWKKPLNKTILLAYAPGTDPLQPGNVLRVRVRNSENFTKFLLNGRPMPLKARHLQADLYELAGPCPRRKGWVPQDMRDQDIPY